MGDPAVTIVKWTGDGSQPKVVDFNFVVLFCLLGMVYCGCNRFTIIPLIFALSSSLSNAAGYYSWNVDKDGKSTATLASTFFTYLGYYFGEGFVALYGYFFLVKLLPYKTEGGLLGRRLFKIIFWTLETINLLARLGGLIFITHDFAMYGHHRETKILYDITLSHFVILTTIELFTAYFLILIFRRSRKMDVRYLGARRLPLLKHMLLSTEIRVASLTILYLLRASCEEPRRLNPTGVAGTLDGIAAPTINLFPLLLVLDCVVRKALNIEVDFQAWIEKCTCVKTDPEAQHGKRGSDSSEGKVPAVFEKMISRLRQNSSSSHVVETNSGSGYD